jgi:tyrosyl-tRNA synthetase
VSIYHSPEAAVQAEEEFKKVFQQKEVPDEMPSFTLQKGQTILDVLVATGMVSSNSDGRRMIEQKGVKLDGEILEKFDLVFPHPGVLQVGKRRFVRVN